MSMLSLIMTYERKPAVYMLFVFNFELLIESLLASVATTINNPSNQIQRATVAVLN
jgi:hypothetical protein